MIDDATVQKALDFLRESAHDIGQAKANAVKAERMVKHVRAIEMKRHNDMPVSAQEREATASEAYVKALNEEAGAAGEYEMLKARREAAAMVIEVWRSQGANYRAMKL